MQNLGRSKNIHDSAGTQGSPLEHPAVATISVITQLSDPSWARGVVPGGVRGGSEEVDAGQAGVSGQDRHHAACGPEAFRVHADAAGLIPQNGHHHLCRHRA